MKDELDGFSTQVSTKMPVVGKASCLTLSVIFVLVKFLFKILDFLQLLSATM
jgi:hypothetical protein